MTASATTTQSAEEIRRGLDHPVIDGDGHLVEVGPVFLDYLKQVGGASIIERYREVMEAVFYRWYRASREERQRQRICRPAFWIVTTDTSDRAAVMMPALLRERMDVFGIDFTMLYPTTGIVFPEISDEEVRRATARASNIMNAELFGPHADRMAVPAIIPTHTPEEALAELDFAVGELGLKTTMMAGAILRTVPAARDAAPDLSADYLSHWIDSLALDSAYDYDPLWQRCIDLGVAVTTHQNSQGWVNRASISNFNNNHIGHFAAASDVFCKALFFGGVTRRFPNLNFAFLECGVGWACALYNDLIGHWEKRSVDALMRNLDPSNVDNTKMVELVERYAAAHLKPVMTEAARHDPAALRPEQPQNPDELDEWAACEITHAEDIQERFVPHFYFGCEADDPMNAVAFNTRLNRFGARLNAMISSDIGHWDVPEADQVLCEAYELVEHGLITEDDFRRFTFANPARLHTGMNPDFFKGTVVEGAVAALNVSA